jgi:hypothetical protein
MVGRLSATAYTCLMVALYVSEPSQVELTVADHVRLDRVTRDSVQAQGDLIQPGTTSVNLAEGTYLFRTTGDAQIQLADPQAVQVVVVAHDKGDFPDLSVAVPDGKGDSAPDRVPTLTVLA